MADFNVQGIRDLQQRLQVIGDNHVRLGGDGQVQAATGGAVSRFFGRLASRFGAGVRNANQATVTALMRQIADTPALGQQYADMFRDSAATVLADGKPLSGRKIVRILDRTVSLAQRAFVTNAIRAGTIRELTAPFIGGEGPDSMMGIAREMEETLGLAAGQSGIDGRAGELGTIITENLARRTSGRQATPDDLRAVAGAVLKEAVLDAYVTVHKDTIVAAVRERFALGDDMRIDTPAFVHSLRTTARNLANSPSLTREAVREALDYSADTSVRVQLYNLLQERLAPFLALDDSPGGLRAAYQAKAGALVEGVVITESALKTLKERLERKIRHGFENRTPPVAPPDAAAIMTVRNRLLDEFFAGLDQWADTISEERGERALFMKTFLATAPAIKPALRDSAMNFSRVVTDRLGDAMRMSNPKDLRLVFEDLSTISADLKNEVKKGAGGADLGSEDFQAMFRFAFSLGIARLGESMGGVEAIGQRMATLGSPFLDMAHELREAVEKRAGERSNEIAILSQLSGVFEAVVDKVPAHLAQRLDLDIITFDMTSLAYQRKVMGHDELSGRGFNGDLGLSGLLVGINDRLRTAMNEIIAGTMKDLPAETLLDPNHADWAFSTDFLRDFNRQGLVVNGRFIRARGNDDTQAQASLFRQFPDRRTAVQVMNMIFQWMPQSLLSGFIRSEEYVQKVQSNPDFQRDMIVPGHQEQTFTIDPEPGNPGLYRISGEFISRSGEDPVQGKERGSPAGIHFRLDYVVQTGGDPTVLSAESDVFLYGWD